MIELDPNRNLTHQVAHAIGHAILCGQYRRDQPFPSEAELSLTYQVSRSATREAVKMLAAKGLLSSRPRQGIRILPESSWNMFDTDVLTWLLNSPRAMELLRDFLQMRIAVEPEAAALAANFPDSEAVARIEQALNRMRAAARGDDDPLASDIAFHTAILAASHNHFFAQLQPFSATALKVSINQTNRAKGVAMADIEAHANVLKQIKKGNANGARKAMRHLLDEALRLIEINL